VDETQELRMTAHFETKKDLRSWVQVDEVTRQGGDKFKVNEIGEACSTHESA
jgi:hypothetical protein